MRPRDGMSPRAPERLLHPDGQAADNPVRLMEVRWQTSRAYAS